VIVSKMRTDVADDMEWMDARGIDMYDATEREVEKDDYGSESSSSLRATDSARVE